MQLPTDLMSRRHPRFAEIKSAWNVLHEASEAGPPHLVESACLAAERLNAIYSEDGRAPKPEGESQTTVQVYLDSIVRPRDDEGREVDWREHPAHRARYFPTMDSIGAFRRRGTLHQVARVVARAIDEGRQDAAKRGFDMLFRTVPFEREQTDGTFAWAGLPEGTDVETYNILAAGLEPPRPQLRRRPSRAEQREDEIQRRVRDELRRALRAEAGR
jgi:hypothetical protein